MSKDQNHNAKHDDDRKDMSVAIEVDGETVIAPAREETPRQIITLARKDPAAFYLVELKGKRERISFKDEPDEHIKLHAGERFITVSLGPTPVS
jgi:hypothetical protein